MQDNVSSPKEEAKNLLDLFYSQLELLFSDTYADEVVLTYFQPFLEQVRSQFIDIYKLDIDECKTTLDVIEKRKEIAGELIDEFVNFYIDYLKEEFITLGKLPSKEGFNLVVEYLDGLMATDDEAPLRILGEAGLEPDNIAEAENSMLELDNSLYQGFFLHVLEVSQEKFSIPQILVHGYGLLLRSLRSDADSLEPKVTRSVLLLSSFSSEPPQPGESKLDDATVDHSKPKPPDNGHRRGGPEATS